MTLHKVILAIARAKQFDTGQRLETYALGTDRLDSALKAEAAMDSTLADPSIEYTHAVEVIPVTAAPAAAALAVAA